MDMRGSNHSASVYEAWHQRNFLDSDRATNVALDTMGCYPLNNAQVNTEVNALGWVLNNVCDSDEKTLTHCCENLTVDWILLALAANAVGKNVNWLSSLHITIDPIEYIKNTGTKTLIIQDTAYLKISESINNLGLKRVIITSLSDYAKDKIDDNLPNELKELLKESLYEKIVKNKPDNIKYDIIAWKDFLQMGKGKKLSKSDTSKVAGDDIFGTFYSSGSTGQPKAIKIMNKGIIAMADDIYPSIYDRINIEPGDRMLAQIHPSHMATTGHMAIVPMLLGATLAINPIFTVDKLLDSMRTLAPINHLVTSPTQSIHLLSGGGGVKTSLAA
jgi:long-subunit acyl-CoA synthetase (AMP-forming)